MRQLMMIGLTLAAATAMTSSLAAQSEAAVLEPAVAGPVAPDAQPRGLRFDAANGAATARLAPEPLPESNRSINWMASNHSTRSEGTALMIVGAAGIILGLVIDEPIVTVAGAVTGGIGLYLYLRHGGEIKVSAEH